MFDSAKSTIRSLTTAGAFLVLLATGVIVGALAAPGPASVTAQDAGECESDHCVLTRLAFLTRCENDEEGATWCRFGDGGDDWCDTYDCEY